MPTFASLVLTIVTVLLIVWQVNLSESSANTVRGVTTPDQGRS